MMLSAMKLLMPPLRAAACATVTGALSSAALAAPVWITVGDAAWAELKKVVPDARPTASVQVPVQVPEKRGSAKLVPATEGVHAVLVEEDALPEFSAHVHHHLHKCGGYVQHDSMAQALAVLHRLQNPAPISRAASRAPSYAIDNQPQVNAQLPQMQASNILSQIEQLAAFQNRRHRSTSGVAASDWLFNQWQLLAGAGTRSLRVRQITHSGWPQKSVVFEFTGSTNGGEIIVLGAHLDSTGSGPFETVRAPGADDDASGVASLTEVIRVLVANNFRPKRTVRFYAYAAEEAGLLGSQQIVAATAGERSQVVGVLQLDMTAFQGDATDLWLYTDYTNAAQNQFLANLAATYLPTLTVGYDRCGYGCSDHAAWHNAGFVASFPFEASDTTYNFALHTVNDTTATFGNQANHALKFAKLALAYAVELGSDGP
jgi:bacterial leucyl aminopeptidase